MNLVYPYFLEGKGWNSPAHRKVQTYDFLLAVIVMIILNLSIWTLGAELLFPQGLTIEVLDDLPRLLSQLLGSGGRVLFYVGIFAAIYSSLVGHALGLGYLGSHAYLRWSRGVGAGHRRLSQPSLVSLDRRLVPRFTDRVDSALACLALST